MDKQEEEEKAVVVEMEKLSRFELWEMKFFPIPLYVS